MNKLQQVKEKLLKLGFTNKKIEELIVLLAPDIEEQIFLDYAIVCTDSDVSALEAKLKNCKNQEEYNTVLEEIATKAYGGKSKEKIEELWVEALEDIAKSTSDLTDFVKKYQAGDPETLKKISDPKIQAKAKAELTKMKAEGIDFEKEVTQTMKEIQEEKTQENLQKATANPGNNS